ncbi:MAG TPA: sialidase family protein [Thermomicrobiales bacterium]|nr:sialidase family protein [Thermomicrobiales bacterium]
MFNDKEWIAADANPTSPYRDRVYVTWTRFVFNPSNGNYVQSPIAFAYSADGGRTFSSPQLISGNVLYGQGSRPIVGPDGTLYVFWDGATRLSTYDSTWMVKSSDGGATWSKPAAVAPLIDIVPPHNTAFRVNSFPAAALTPDGTLYAAWTTELKNGATGYSLDRACADFLTPGDVSVGCHAAVAYSTSADGGATWSAPTLAFGAADRTAVAYPVMQPDGTTLSAPAARPVDTFFPAIAAGPDGTVYLSAYAADVVSPWQSCAKYDPNASVHCLTPGPYINNAKLDYVVKNLGAGTVTTATQKPINTRYQFRGAFIGDYTDLAVGSDGTYHALWTDTNNQQTIYWWYGVNLGGLLANEQDVVTYAGR